MLRILSYSIQLAVLALVVYDAGLAWFGWAQPARAAAGRRERRFRVVVPAHDEAHVVGHVVRDLVDQDYDARLVTVWVLADRCADDTARVAAQVGARVSERGDGPEGKAALLRWHLDAVPLDRDEALVVLDADTRVPSTLLAHLADELDTGAEVLQCYLDVANPDASWMATASALSYWAGNRMTQLPRTRLGWSADLGGTGMCVTSHALDAAGGFGDSMSEDRELALRLLAVGFRVQWLHHVRILDEKPTAFGTAVRQRARWARGLSQVRRHHLRPMIRLAVRGNLSAFDHALRLLRPSRSTVAAMSGPAAAAAVVGVPTLLPSAVWAPAFALQLILPIIYLLRDGVPWHFVRKYPVAIALPLLAVPVRVRALVTHGWVHTPHVGGGDAGSTRSQ